MITSTTDTPGTLLAGPTWHCCAPPSHLPRRPRRPSSAAVWCSGGGGPGQFTLLRLRACVRSDESMDHVYCWRLRSPKLEQQHCSSGAAASRPRSTGSRVLLRAIGLVAWAWLAGRGRGASRFLSGGEPGPVGPQAKGNRQ
jgi:hypothetical protein